MKRNKFSTGKKMIEKLERRNQTISLNVLYVKKEKYILLMFQNITQNLKHKLFFYWFQVRRTTIALSCCKRTQHY